MQRLDGLFGALIVYDDTRPSYPSFTVQINDWLHMDSDQFATTLIGPGDPVAKFAGDDCSNFSHVSMHMLD